MTQNSDQRSKDQEAEAQAALDQLRTQAGGALSGREITRRLGLKNLETEDAPPLDWRLTPRNVILQLIAIAAFVAIVWLMGSLIYDGVSALYGHVTQPPARP